MIALLGCGSDDETPGDRSGANTVTQEDGRKAAPDTSQQGEEASKKSTSQTAEEERVARLIERMREAEEQEPSEELGCERYTFAGGEEPIYSIGPPPPEIKVSRVRDGALISYRFSSLPDNETCRPFGLYMTVSGADVPNRSPTFEKRTEDVRLRGLSGKRVVEFPLAGRPPYQVAVASFSITGRSGPRVTLLAP